MKDKENEMIVDISTICLFFHKWSKWEKIFRVYDFNWYRFRYCTKCGKVQSSIIKKNER
jgi:hypothetical protein